MRAIGMIETRGLIPCIEAADVMLKTSQVDLVERSFVGGGLVTVIVTGDVAAVKAAVDAGASAVRSFGENSLKSEHVIPRPHEDVSLKLFDEDLTKVKEEVILTERIVELPDDEGVIVDEKIEKESIPQDLGHADSKIDYLIEDLENKSIQELRELARKENKMSHNKIMKANKVTLIKHLKDLAD